MFLKRRTSRQLIHIVYEQRLNYQRLNFYWKRIFFILLGLGFFLLILFYGSVGRMLLTFRVCAFLYQQKVRAIALFFIGRRLVGFEVIPIGITSIVIGVFRTVQSIRYAKRRSKILWGPVRCVLSSARCLVGLAFTKSGLSKRIAYKMLEVVGEKASMILLGCLVVLAGLVHFMRIPAAATVAPYYLQFVPFTVRAINSQISAGAFRQVRRRLQAQHYHLLGSALAPAAAWYVQGIYRKRYRVF